MLTSSRRGKACSKVNSVAGIHLNIYQLVIKQQQQLFVQDVLLLAEVGTSKYQIMLAKQTTVNATYATTNQAKKVKYKVKPTKQLNSWEKRLVAWSRTLEKAVGLLFTCTLSVRG